MLFFFSISSVLGEVQRSVAEANSSVGIYSDAIMTNGVQMKLAATHHLVIIVWLSALFQGHKISY